MFSTKRGTLGEHEFMKISFSLLLCIIVIASMIMRGGAITFLPASFCMCICPQDISRTNCGTVVKVVGYYYWVDGTN